MRFDIKEIGDDGLVVDVPVTEAWLARECPGIEPRLGPRGLSLRGTLTKSGDDVFLRGTLSGEMTSTCVRCLEEARIPVSIAMLTTFEEKSPDDDDEAEVEGELAEEADMDFASFDGEEIDLGPEIRDQLTLALPMNPVCSEDCRGLCSICGGNRNQVPCDCEEKARRAASPLGGLRHIKLSD
jgi:uncharacterized protein